MYRRRETCQGEVSCCDEIAFLVGYFVQYFGLGGARGGVGASTRRLPSGNSAGKGGPPAGATPSLFLAYLESNEMFSACLNGGMLSRQLMSLLYVQWQARYRLSVHNWLLSPAPLPLLFVVLLLPLLPEYQS